MIYTSHFILHIANKHRDSQNQSEQYVNKINEVKEFS